MGVRSKVPVYRAAMYYPSYSSSKATMRPRAWSAAPPARSSYYGGYTSPSFSKADSVAYDTRVEDYLLSGRVDDASYLSNAVLDDTYDTARRSRGRDQKLLRDATQAIVSSESYATPRESVAARRVQRGLRSAPPRAVSVPPRPADAYAYEAAIIASKLEPDPLKRRRPKSEYAANKYRAIRREQKESIYGGTPGSSGLSASTPPLTGVDPRNPPVSDLRRRIRRTLNKTRNS